MKCGCDVHNVTTAIILKIVLRLLPTFAGVLREKIPTRASFTKILGNYIFDKNVNNCSFRYKFNLNDLFLRKCQEPVRRETTEGSSVEFIGYRMPQHS